MRALSLFSGIGGLDIAAEAAGIEIATLCEIEPFCVSVLNKRWPHVPVIDDVRKVNKETFNEPVDVVFGGFPCQDLSVARQDRGQRKGLGGERSGLWFEMERVIRELGPAWVLAENVRGAVDLALDTVTENLEDAGYEVRTFLIPASAYGVPHRRERMFVCAARKDVADACGDRLKEAGGLQVPCQEGTEPLEHWAKVHGYEHRAVGERGGDAGGDGALEGQLNPDWVEQLMCFPEGWTDVDVDVPKAWAGFPARPRIIRLENWATPLASDCKGGATNFRSLRKDVYGLKKEGLVCPQYPFEFPRLVKGGGNKRAARLKALGNAVVPLQAYPLFMAMAEMNRLLGGGNDNSG